MQHSVVKQNQLHKEQQIDNQTPSSQIYYYGFKQNSCEVQFMAIHWMSEAKYAKKQMVQNAMRAQ